MTLVVQSLDAAFAPDRLHFSWIDDPSETRGDGVDRDVKESGAFRLTNTSAEAVTILGAGLDGPFVIDGPALAGRTIPAGGALDVTVLFDRAQFQAPSGSAGAVNGASAVFTGQVRIETSAGTAPPVMLAGTWQPVSEGGYEPNVNEVWEAFGFSNRIEGLSTQNNGGRSVLDTKGSYAVFDDAEVLSPYWRIADGYDSFTVTQLGGFAGPLSGMNIDIHGLGDLGSLKRLWRVAPEDTQMILPDRATGGGAQAPATRSLDAGFIPDAWTGDAIFGFFIGEASSDPTLNTPGSYLRGADGSQWRTFNGGVTAMNEATGQYKPVEDIERIQQGQWIRSYAARDADGNAINHTYLLIYDTPDGNHDYNDVMLLVQGVTVAEYGPVLNVIGLSEGGAGSRLVFSNIENPNVSAATVALGGQVTRDQITLTLENAGEGVLDISGVAVTGPDADVFSASLTTAADGRQQLTVTFSGTDPARDRIAERYEAALVIG